MGSRTQKSLSSIKTPYKFKQKRNNNRRPVIVQIEFIHANYFFLLFFFFFSFLLFFLAYFYYYYLCFFLFFTMFLYFLVELKLIGSFLFHKLLDNFNYVSLTQFQYQPKCLFNTVLYNGFCIGIGIYWI